MSQMSRIRQISHHMMRKILHIKEVAALGALLSMHRSLIVPPSQRALQLLSRKNFLAMQESLRPSSKLHPLLYLYPNLETHPHLQHTLLQTVLCRHLRKKSPVLSKLLPLSTMTSSQQRPPAMQPITTSNHIRIFQHSLQMPPQLQQPICNFCRHLRTLTRGWTPPPTPPPLLLLLLRVLVPLSLLILIYMSRMKHLE